MQSQVTQESQEAVAVVPENDIILDVNGIEVIYNHVILVLRGVSLAVPKGKIVALLGANGAGKTTTLRAISNLLKSERGEVTKGSITYKGEEIQNLTPADLVKRGVIQVMEGRHCFEHLTIEENLQEQLDSYGNFLIGQAEASLERIIQQLNLLKEQLEQRKKAITTASH